MKRILVIEDEPDIRELIALNLQTAGLEVREAGDGLEGLRMAESDPPDLIVLDLMLPGLDGLEVFRRLQGNPATRKVPVIMLTAKAQTEDRIAGLEMGADDYLTKPFSPRELLLRIKALLRRAGESGDGAAVLDIDNLHLDLRRQRFLIDGEDRDLTLTEFRLIALLMEHQGSSLDRATLLKDVWGYSDTIHTRTLDTHIKRLRQKLGAVGDRIVTKRGSAIHLNRC